MPQTALEGIRVLDLSQGIAGPYCTRLFSTYGAEVIKVEDPSNPDEARKVGPFPADVPDSETSGIFLYLNTNKQGITLNLRSPTGAKLFKELVRRSDVLVESFAPKAMQRWGLSYRTLKGINPRLVMTSITPFGQTGPYRDWKSTELTLMSICGVMKGTGEPDREPLKSAVSFAQFSTGLQAYIATLAAYQFTVTTGKGQYLDLSIMECVSGLLGSNMVTTSMTGGGEGRRSGNKVGGLLGTFKVKDGYMGTIVFEEHQWVRLRDWVGIPELKEPRFQTAQGRTEHRSDLIKYLSPWFDQWTKQELYRVAQEKFRLPFGYAATVEDLLKSPHLAERQYFVQVDHPRAGRLTYPGAPFKMEGSPARIVKPAPLLGQHNVEVFCDKLGLEKRELARLKARGII